MPIPAEPPADPVAGRLGVGTSFPVGRPDALAAVLDAVDYVEISPDVLAAVDPDRPAAGARLDPVAAGRALDLVAGTAVVVHGLELSIGSAHGWNAGYFTVLDAFLDLCEARGIRPPWHSEHLGFLDATDAAGGPLPLGLPMPVPFTAEAAGLVAARADAVLDRYGLPFLLENAAYYLPDLPADPGWDEPRLLTELTRRSRAGLLLDLFNLHVNCVNHGLDADRMLDAIPLDRVVEVHLAGGLEHDGLLLDAHSGGVPEPVWRLAERVAAEAPRLAGITVEVLDLHVDRLGEAGLREELDRARAVWSAVPA